MNRLRQLWVDDRGAIVASEILVIATILVIGLMVAWVAVRSAMIEQINDQADWISGEEVDDSDVQRATGMEEILTCSDLIGSDGE